MALEEAKILNFRFHDLRHTCATRFADAGINFAAIGEILGHSDIRTTERYSHATEKAKREAMQKLVGIETGEQVLSKSKKKENRQAVELAC